LKYQEFLLDPRWLKKRKKILKRDNYCCTACGSNENLQVHHTYYLKCHVFPWSYPDDSLLTVCDKCHKHYHETHELTIKYYHSDGLSHKVNKKPKKSKKKQPKKKQDKPKEESRGNKKKAKRGFPLEKLEEKTGRLVYRKRNLIKNND